MLHLLFLAALAIPSDDTFIVDFQTDVKNVTGGAGTISILLNRSLAPLGVDHLRTLVEDNFYDGAAFFRVVPNFVVQFGIAGTPSKNTKWNTPILDDPVKTTNAKGTLVYATAGPNTRTTQLFINYQLNAGLDRQGFAPLGHVIAGMDLAVAIFNPTPGSSGGVDQDEYTREGDAWIKSKYPKINFIVSLCLAFESIISALSLRLSSRGLCV